MAIELETVDQHKEREKKKNNPVAPVLPMDTVEGTVAYLFLNSLAATSVGYEPPVFFEAPKTPVEYPCNPLVDWAGVNNLFPEIQEFNQLRELTQKPKVENSFAELAKQKEAKAQKKVEQASLGKSNQTMFKPVSQKKPEISVTFVKTGLELAVFNQALIHIAAFFLAVGQFVAKHAKALAEGIPPIDDNLYAGMAYTLAPGAFRV